MERRTYDDDNSITNRGKSRKGQKRFFLGKKYFLLTNSILKAMIEKRASNVK